MKAEVVPAPHLSARVLKVLLLAAALLVAIPGVAAADSGERPLFTVLSGAAEVPGPGDPDGFGIAVLQARPDAGRLCYVLNVKRIEPATAAHVHIGAAGVAGPVVINLEPPSNGSTRACTTADPALLRAIVADPAGYYVNVHNRPFPAGAVRGQLR